MWKKRSRVPLWLIVSLVGLVVLTACTAALTEPGIVAVMPLGEKETDNEGSVEELGSEELGPTGLGTENTLDDNEAVDLKVAAGPEILTEDDRSDRLRSLTRSWNTNWNLHTVAYDEILSGGPPRDGIRSIDQPKFISPEQAEEWLAGNEPVIAFELNGDARAYPLQIITWHEIINDEVGGVPAVVTFCPLCNSALAFDRTVNGEVFEFGVSGLLRNSDLIMYDRTTETLWQQFTGDAIVGDLTGIRLEFLPTSIGSFRDFRNAHPDGLVLSRDTGLRGGYGTNPYAGYDTYDHVLSAGGNLALFKGDLDGRLAPADRVVTVSLDDVSIDVAYPVSLLSEIGVINDNQGGRDLVVFFKSGTASALGSGVIANAEDVGATGVFDPNHNGQKLTFVWDGTNIVDEDTNSVWNILGQAVDGPLAGAELDPIVHGDHFWFSWAAFKPNTIIYSNR
jgi:hypothetical protein